MKYKEIFLMNQIYVVHPNKRIPIKLCPRDEVAHPDKLACIVNNLIRKWKEIKINGLSLYYMRIEYDKKFYKDLSSSHLYVLIDDKSADIFIDAQNVHPDCPDDMYLFLQKHGFSLFGITSPVFNLDVENAPNIYYGIPVNMVNDPVYLAPGSIVELRELINTRCYTICNGLTLFLAMVRAKIWNSGKAYDAIQKWYKKNPNDNNIEMNEIWQVLYINHPVPMISEFPSYYSTMFPPVQKRFLEHLYLEDTIPLTQFVNDTDPDNIVCYYSTPLTSMFPYFNKDIFDHYNDNFVLSDDIPTIFEVPFVMDDEDEQLIDIEGFFIAILRSRRAWKWWKRYGSIYFRKAYNTNLNSGSFFMNCFQALFYLYTIPYIDIKYTRSKVRNMWVSLLTIFDISPSEIKLFVNIIIIKTIIYKKFVINRWNPIIPTSFMIDIMNIYKDNMDWFGIYKKKVFTSNIYNTTELMSIFAPYMHISTEVPNEYSMFCSFYQLLKLNDMGSVFVNHILDKRICKKLLCVQKIFGIKPDEEPLVPLSEHNASAIGNILYEYLRLNRNLLI